MCLQIKAIKGRMFLHKPVRLTPPQVHTEELFRYFLVLRSQNYFLIKNYFNSTIKKSAKTGFFNVSI